jgi:phenylacetaldehyde dehydrogenase
MMPPAPSAETLSSLARPFEMLIDGDWRSAIDGDVLDVVNPADGAVIATILSGGAGDVDAAVAAARRAFEDRRWTGMTPGARARVLWKVADLIEARATEFAELETLDNGKPVSAARAMDVPAAAAAFRYWAGWCTRPTGETHAVDLPGEYLAYTVREPVGVVALITPWNFPLVMASAKLAPALAAGCAIVLKPAEQTSLTALRLGEVLMEAGVPAGVVNVVTGLGRAAGAALANHPDVDKISFTGSTLVGKDLVGAARGNLKRLTLELGGKSPTLILADADLTKAIPAAANGIFRNAGQMCAAGSRLFVERSRFDEVVEGVVAHAGSLRMGPGMDPATTLGPLVSRVQHERVLGYIDSARHEGATLATGGGAPGGAGYFVEPTVVIDARPDMRVVREEIFGPVLVATPVDDLDDLAALANDTEFGLSAGIWTRDVAAAQRLARQLKAGTVTINSGMVTGPNLPFGGFKQSGWGREGGAAGIEAYLESKTVVTAL